MPSEVKYTIEAASIPAFNGFRQEICQKPGFTNNFFRFSINHFTSGVNSGFFCQRPDNDKIVDYVIALESLSFKKTIAQHPDGFPLLWQHDSHSPVGIIYPEEKFGRGLGAEFDISDTSLGRDVSSLIDDSVPLGLSIGFEVLQADFLPYSEKGKPDYLPRVRYVREVRLDEVSVVTFPADDKAVIYKQGIIPANRQALPQRIRNRYPVQKPNFRQIELQRTLRRVQRYLSLQKADKVLKENGR
jgi:HK97 family phage prohead protease